MKSNLNFHNAASFLHAYWHFLNCIEDLIRMRYQFSPGSSLYILFEFDLHISTSSFISSIILLGVDFIRSLVCAFIYHKFHMQSKLVEWKIQFFFLNEAGRRYLLCDVENNAQTRNGFCSGIWDVVAGVIRDMNAFVWLCLGKFALRIIMNYY